MLQLTSKAGVVYQESAYDGSWWIIFKTDKPNRHIGAEHELPKEILKQLSKIRRPTQTSQYKIDNYGR